MDTDVIFLLTNALVLFSLGAGIFYTTAKGLPLVTETVEQFAQLVLTIAPVLRRLFDPNTRLAKALEAKGVNAEIADTLAELGADVLVMIAKPYLPETVAKGAKPLGEA
jgi:hypothetical protein